MNAVQLLQESLKNAHEWFEGTMADVSPDMAHKAPPGQAHAIVSRYAHVVVSEDMMVNGMLKKGAPLMASTFAGKTGVSDPQNAFITTLDWAQKVKVDLPALRQYAQAVYNSTDAYVAALKESDLDNEVDLSQWNMGKWKLGPFLTAFVIGHVRDIMGEV